MFSPRRVLYSIIHAGVRAALRPLLGHSGGGASKDLELAWFPVGFG